MTAIAMGGACETSCSPETWFFCSTFDLIVVSC
jgi:hypothetical protein